MFSWYIRTAAWTCEVIVENSPTLWTSLSTLEPFCKLLECGSNTACSSLSSDDELCGAGERWHDMRDDLVMGKEEIS